MDDEVNFLTLVDGEDVYIIVKREENYSEADDLSILYIYKRLAESMEQAEQNKKGSKIKDEL